MSEELEVAVRYDTKEKAVIEIYGKSGVVVARLQNLSQTGARITWEDKAFDLQKGELIRLVVNLKSLKREHKMNAEVVWARKSACGVHFINTEELVEKMVAKGV